MASTPPEIRLFGVRHHGPGCARGLRRALDAFVPGLVLIEGPPEGDPLIPFVADKAMKPPVALLIYDAAQPGEASVYPFHTFSPEWQALRWAAENAVEAHFIDLPLGARERFGGAPRSEQSPFSLMAEAAGYEDPEAWWEDTFEQRPGDEDIFPAIAEAMRALREGYEADELELAREAHMRRAIRRAGRAGFRRIAVICGAWHLPALEGGDPRQDEALLRKLRPKKLTATWIPWTASRLARRSGYGAGVAAPGWYELLFQGAPDRSAQWIARAARQLRAEGEDASAAQVIDAVRLAEALAAMRQRSAPGRAELSDAMLAALFAGDAQRMQRSLRPLELGEALGAVPERVPAMPIQRDLEQQIRRLRLRRKPFTIEQALDLRKDRDREKSALLHQLGLLGVNWGQLRDATGRERSTFRESWELRWEPEFPVRIAEAAPLGNTVALAASARVRELLSGDPALSALVELLDTTLHARLEDTLDEVLAALSGRAALATELGELLGALPPLVHTLRYGDVRGTPAEQLSTVLDALLERSIVGLPAAASLPDEEGAAKLADQISSVNASLALLPEPRSREDWLACLHTLAGADGVVPRVRGRATRLLVEADAIDGDALIRLAGANLSRAGTVYASAQWIQGLIQGSGVALMHQPRLWQALDRWINEVDEEDFVSELPGLRRAFAAFTPSERRMMGRLLRQLSSDTPAALTPTEPLDPARVALVLPTLTLLLGGADVAGA